MLERSFGLSGYLIIFIQDPGGKGAWRPLKDAEVAFWSTAL